MRVTSFQTCFGQLWLRTQFPALMGGEIAVPVKMAYFAVLVFAVTIIIGLTPALHTTGVNLNTYLASGAVFKRRFFSLQELFSMRTFHVMRINGTPSFIENHRSE